MKRPPLPWDPDFPDRSPLLSEWSDLARPLAGPDWPSLADFQRLADRRMAQPVRFVLPAGPLHRFEGGYEARVHLRREVETRLRGWHDLFNALVWAGFPRAKTILNERHCAELRQGGEQRGPHRDAATLFDESGVIILCADPALAGLLGGFRWKALFWQHRADVIRRMRFILFGHGLMEKALAPYVGITGHGVLPVPEEQLRAPLREVDERLAKALRAGAAATLRELTPLPLLGVPGWWPANEAGTFYDDAGYFRPGRRR